MPNRDPLGSSLTVPIHDGRLCFGNFQGICIYEHRRHGGHRRIVVTVQGEVKVRQPPVIQLPSNERPADAEPEKTSSFPPHVIHLPAKQPDRVDQGRDRE